MSKPSMTASDVMKSGIKTVSPRMTLPELEEAFVAEGVSGFPVVEDGRLIGVVSRSDVVRQLCMERRVAETVSDFHYQDGRFVVEEMESFQQIADRVGERIESLSVADVMNQRPLTIPPSATIRDVAHQMVTHHVHRLPVTDQGVLVGIITSIDLTRLISDSLFVQRGRDATS